MNNFQTRVWVFVGINPKERPVRILTAEELLAIAIPAPAEVLTSDQVAASCCLPRRNPITPANAILGGMVDAVNAALLDACPDLDCKQEKNVCLDFAEWICNAELIARLYELVLVSWPDATMDSMKLSIVVSPTPQALRIAA